MSSPVAANSPAQYFELLLGAAAPQPGQLCHGECLDHSGCGDYCVCVCTGFETSLDLFHKGVLNVRLIQESTLSEGPRWMQLGHTFKGYVLV